MTSGPKVRFGTKTPSITSHWMRSTPAVSSAAHSSPSREKSAGSTDGAICTSCDDIRSTSGSRQTNGRLTLTLLSAAVRHGTRSGRGWPYHRRSVGRRRADRWTITVEKVVAGGLGLGHAPDGRVVLADGGLPGERVRSRSRRRARSSCGVWCRSSTTPSPDRRRPPCPEADRGCGGCDLQHHVPAAQRQIKVDIIVDALATAGPHRRSRRRRDPYSPRSGTEPPFDAASSTGASASGPTAPTMSMVFDDCLVAHESVAEIVRDGRFGAATEVVVRSGRSHR